MCSVRSAVGSTTREDKRLFSVVHRGDGNRARNATGVHRYEPCGARVYGVFENRNDLLGALDENEEKIYESNCLLSGNVLSSMGTLTRNSNVFSGS